MKRRRLYVLSLILVLLCMLLVPGSVLGDGGTRPPPGPELASDEPRQPPLEEAWEDWYVNVHWYNPELVGSYTLEVSMISPGQGDVRVWTGFEGYHLYGDILTDGTRVFWHLEWLAFYLGRFSDPTHMSGIMLNRTGNYGFWWAVKAGPGEEPALPSQPGVEVGVGGLTDP